jgi:hypothetical protein
MGKGSFIPSIGVDSCIIEEQEDHLVLAIRIPKATIISNLAVLGALADCCGAENQKVWSTRSDPPLRSRRGLAIGGFFRSLLVFLLVPAKL